MGWMEEQAYGPSHLREVTCEGCGWSWKVRGHQEYGKWLPEDDEHMLCPVCLEKIG